MKEFFKVKFANDQLTVEGVNEPYYGGEKIVEFDDILIVYIEATDLRTAKQLALARLLNIELLSKKCRTMLALKPLAGVKIDGRKRSKKGQK